MNFHRLDDNSWLLNDQLSIARPASDHPTILRRCSNTQDHGGAAERHSTEETETDFDSNIFHKRSSSIMYDTANHLNQIRLLPMRTSDSLDTIASIRRNATSSYPIQPRGNDVEDNVRTIRESVPISNSPFASELMTLDNLISSVFEESRITTQKSNELLESKQHVELNRILEDSMKGMTSIHYTSKMQQQDALTNIGSIYPTTSSDGVESQHPTQACISRQVSMSESSSTDFCFMTSERTNQNDFMSSSFITLDSFDDKKDEHLKSPPKKARMQ